MWIHLHIPKNAGTTFRHILDRSYCDAHYSVYDQYNKKDQKYRGHFAAEELRRFITCAPEGTQIISGHHIMMLDENESVDLGVRYLTWIRHPVARVISLYNYERKWAQRRPDIYGDHHPSLESFDHYVKVRMDRDDHLVDWQCYDLSGDRRYDFAKQKLSRCDVVGVVERFDDSLLAIRQALGTGLKLCYQQKNVASDKSRRELTVSDSTKALILDSNTNDLKLFEDANARLTMDLAAIPAMWGKRTAMSAKNAAYRFASSQKSLSRRYYTKLRSGVRTFTERKSNSD